MDEESDWPPRLPWPWPLPLPLPLPLPPKAGLKPVE